MGRAMLYYLGLEKIIFSPSSMRLLFKSSIMYDFPRNPSMLESGPS